MKKTVNFTAAVVLALLFASPLVAESAAQAGPQLSAATISAALSKNAVTRGNFTLTRSSPKSKRALKSSGNYTVASRYGIIWQTTNPVETTQVVTEDFMLLKNPRGQSKKISASEMPVFKQMAVLISALWTNNLDAAAQNAEINFWADGSAWKIELIPNDAAVRSVLNKIFVTGTHSAKETFVDSIKMQQTDGSEFLYELSNHQFFDTITDDEKSLFTKSAE